MERIKRIELLYSDWKSDILTIKLYPHIYRFLSFFAGCIKYISTYETSSSFSSDWIRKLCLPTKISDFHSKARRWTLYWFSHYKHSGSSHHAIYEVVIYYSICPYVLVVGFNLFYQHFSPQWPGSPALSLS